jgi:hypothetical protein
MKIGSFIQQSERMIVTDPSYTYDPDDQISFDVVIEHVRKGTYDVYATMIDNRIASIIVYTQSHCNNTWEEIGSAGVDTGQLGIYDMSRYTNSDDDLLGSKQVVVLPYGCISSSGCGDGVYNVYTLSEGNNVIGVKVVFIDPEEE